MPNRTPSCLACLLLGAILLSSFGCRSTPASHGRKHDIVATYRFMTLTADLPAPATIASVHAAAEQVFRARGYAISESKLTNDAASLAAVPPRSTDFPRTVCHIARSGAAVRIELTTQPLGDEEACRSVLDGILKRLSM